MKIKSVGIVGLGALGVMYGNHLVKQIGKEKLLIIADEKRVAKYEKEGIYCNGEKCEFGYLTPQAEANKLDLIIFTVKFSALENAIEAARPYIGKDTIILSMLNGIISEDFILQRISCGHVLYCTVQGMDAQKIGNQVTYTKVGYIAYGEKSNQKTEQVKAVAEFFEASQLEYQIPPDMNHQMWGKLVLNVGVNQTVTVFETTYGGIQKPGEARDMLIGAMKEAAAVAKHEGVEISDLELEDWVKLLDTLSPDGMPSMRQDALAHRKTEVDLFAGTICNLGKKHQVSTPINDYLYSKITEMESRFQ